MAHSSPDRLVAATGELGRLTGDRPATHPMRAVRTGETVRDMNATLHSEMARALVAERQREAKAFARSRNSSHEQSHPRNVVGVRVLAAGLREKAAALTPARHQHETEGS